MAIADADNVVELSSYQDLALSVRTQAMMVLDATAGDVIRANGDLVAYGGSIAANDNLRIVLGAQLSATSDLLLRRVRITADANTAQRGEGTVVGTFALELPSNAATIVDMVTFVTDEGMFVSAAASDVELVGGSN